MAKRTNSIVLDAALNIIRNGSTRMAVCSAEPTSYADVATYRLAEATTNSTELSVGAGTGQGRRLTTTLKTGASISVTGNANHIALHDNSATLFYVTTCPLQSLTAGGTVNIPAWSIDIAGPS